MSLKKITSRETKLILAKISAAHQIANFIMEDKDFRQNILERCNLPDTEEGWEIVNEAVEVIANALSNAVKKGAKK